MFGLADYVYIQSDRLQTVTDTFKCASRFTAEYIATALWSSTDDADDTGGEPLYKNYSAANIAPLSLWKMCLECTKFESENAEALEVGDSGDAGHDFWLTRNGHGAGFWDGDWPEPEATKLTGASKRFGECNLYVGDDGWIYVG